MRKFSSAVLNVITFPYMDKKQTFFVKTAHWYGLKCLDNCLFIRTENIKTSLKI